QSTPPGYSNWGEWMIDTGGMDRGRWKGDFDDTLKVVIGKDNMGRDMFCSGDYIKIETATGDLKFDPSKITPPATGVSGATLCNNLKESYPSGSNRIIPLATTGAVKF
ncbi:MAG: hypothetical protein K2P17_06650, partial [Helicobacteraceae bacterium]|nr:hypothetical protein [Helicobacteraceae bacterium]